MNIRQQPYSAWEASKATIARDFGGASVSYDGAARLQRRMGARLLELRADLGPAGCADVLDLGCGTGFFTEILVSSQGSPELVTGVDLSPGMIAHARELRTPGIQWLVGDASQLPLADESVDLVFSNLMIQWCPDPLPVLRECLRVLRPGGRLFCSTLLDGTLRELAAAWEIADPGRIHINRFEQAASLLAAVSSIFPDSSLCRESIVLDYDRPIDLLGELKALGANFKGRGRRPTLTAPGRIRQLCEAYPKTSDGQVLASYEAGYMIGQKPSASIHNQSAER